MTSGWMLGGGGGAHLHSTSKWPHQPLDTVWLALGGSLDIDVTTRGLLQSAVAKPWQSPAPLVDSSPWPVYLEARPRGEVPGGQGLILGGWRRVSTVNVGTQGIFCPFPRRLALEIAKQWGTRPSGGVHPYSPSPSLHHKDPFAVLR